MAEIGVKIIGYNRVQNKLRKTAAANEHILDPAVRKWAQHVRGSLKGKPYPPKPYGSTYIRTGNLANRFAVRRLGDARYMVVNTAKYASFVVGDKQAWMHVGRWWKASDVINEQLPELRKNISEEIDKIWED